MKNCLIMGSGRSGTSMLAGILNRAGYFQGDKLHPAMASNPKGFFEWKEINALNEEILANYGRKTWRGACLRILTGKGTVDWPLGKSQRWLLALPPTEDVSTAPQGVEERIRSVLAREPFAYKDPRFSYTLPVWTKYLKGDTVFLCIFREPGAAAGSMLKERGAREYLKNLYMNRQDAYRVWLDIYSHILYRHLPALGNFVFIHYRQVLDGSALPRLSEVLETPLNHDFADASLNRTKPDPRVPLEVQKLYNRLCELSAYTERRE